MAGRVQDDSDALSEMHEINVTPFIDVILVLLIIFMVAAPLSTVDVPVELPVAVAKPAPRPDKPVFVTIKSDLTLAIGEKPINRQSLIQELELATKLKRDQRVFVRADKSVPYDALMQTLNELRIGGFLKVGLVGLEGSEKADGATGPGESVAPIATAPEAPPTAVPVEAR